LHLNNITGWLASCRLLGEIDLVLPDRLVRRDDGLAIPGFAENVKVGQPPALGVG